MTLSFPRLFAQASRQGMPVPALGRILARLWRRAGSVALDPEALSDQQKRDIGLLDGRGPLNRRPERDPTAGP
ncbi:hypothetical protein [uncultured Alsobacter sp.]|uniref:hypothetical protein n=1 Tax=uncultured Alsobacter sp. TaxID=1748258 RepID=UPI0025EDDAD8|nr:hypothetical protein [uncultured Alsobacter sp.]